MILQHGFGSVLTLCAVLGVAGSLIYFYLAAGAKAKRLWHPRIVFGGAALFLLYVVLSFPASALIGAVPATAIVAFVMLKTIRFCSSCGQLVTRSPVWVSLNYCSHCGERLQRRAACE